jgi:hypothetical protein
MMHYGNPLAHYRPPVDQQIDVLHGNAVSMFRTKKMVERQQ